MRIESGPNTERIVRNSLFFILIAVFGFLFIKDGYGGYQKNNLQEHLDSLETDDRARAAEARVYDQVNTKNTEALNDIAAKAVSKVTLTGQRAALAESLGGPPSVETPDAIYYFGPDYRIKFPIKNGKLMNPVGSPAAHKMTDIKFQRIIGWALSAVALISLVQLIRILTTNCVLDDDGLKYRYKGRVNWDQMKSLESSLFTKKGWVDLVYSTPGGDRRMRLDEYHFKLFPDIIAEICSRKGFDDPVAAEKRTKAQEAAAKQDARQA